jgi:head decoration protein D
MSSGYGSTPGTVFTSPAVHAGGFMVSEADNIAREQIIVLEGESFVPGMVIGKIMVGATAVAVPGTGNTANGVMGAIVAGAAQPGRYTLSVLTAGAAAEFELTAPDGEVQQGAVGTPFNALGLGFTLPDGSVHAAAGDNWSIVVSPGTEKYREYNPANTDGSETPVGISWDFYNAVAGDMEGAAIVRDAVVNEAELTWFAGATAGQIAAALYALAEGPHLVARASL